MAVVLKGSSNSTFRIIPHINSNSNLIYKSLIIDNSNNIFNILNYNSNGFIGIGTENPSESFEIRNSKLKFSGSNNNNEDSSIYINNSNICFYNSNNKIIGLIGIHNNKNYLNLISSNECKGFYFTNELLVNELRPEIDIWHRTIDNNSRFKFLSNSTTILQSPNGYQFNNNEGNGVLFLANNGNLGIGISNPITNLYVSSGNSNQFPFKFSTNSNNSNGSFIALNTDDVNWCKCAIGHIKTGDFDTGDIIFINRNSLDEVNVNSQDDEKMRIKNNGNIGFSIKNPIANLHINNSNENQTVIIKISDKNHHNGLSLFKSSNNNSYLINSENTNLIIGVNNNDNYIDRQLGIRIDNSNNLNLNKNLNFDAYSNAEFSITLVNDNNQIPNYKSSLFYYDYNTEGTINIGRDIGWGSTKTYIHSNLGIGTSPIEKLHVQGPIASINDDSSNFIRFLNENSSGYIDTGSYENGIAFRINSSRSNYITANTNLNEVMRIKSNGNIGIGNNNPISNENDTNLCIGNCSLLNSSGNLIISKSSGNFQRNIKFGYGNNNYFGIGDFGSNNNNSNSWRQQIRIHWNSPNNSFLIYENGDANLYGRLYQPSDIRIKTNIKPIENALSKVNQLNGVEYSYIDNNNDNNNDNNHIGLIAQEVEKIVPQVVHHNKDTDMKSVAYGNLTPILINAIKELNEKIIKLEGKLGINTI